MTDPSSEPPSVREEVIDLITGCDPIASENAGRLIDMNGRPYSPRQAELHRSATHDEKITAAERELGRYQYVIQHSEDRERLKQLAQAAPGIARDAYIDELYQHPQPEDTPRAGDVPAAEITGNNARLTAVYVTAFRRHILPELGGPARDEAQQILERLAPIAAPYLSDGDNPGPA